ncbi:MAG: hypothetical protein KDB03_28850 [Planctomycetales bacterium]|nr:hypothetical protein [Planctomycetales bacterium]
MLTYWKEAEAEGSPIMDDRANDGRGARMASEGAGQGSGPDDRMKVEG